MCDRDDCSFRLVTPTARLVLPCLIRLRVIAAEVTVGLARLRTYMPSAASLAMSYLMTGAIREAMREVIREVIREAIQGNQGGHQGGTHFLAVASLGSESRSRMPSL